MRKEQSMPNFVELEHNVLKMWEDKDIFKKLVKKNENAPVYKALDGPITANNAMGIHHVWGRTLKDLYIKYKAMSGFAPRYQNGFDAHGLPVEVEVEKSLGIESKKDIVNYGVSNFVDKCMDRVEEFSKTISNQSKRFGQLMDWENSYYTNSDENITSIWHFLKKVSDKGWLVKSYKPMQWCPRCATSLSTHEMHGSYKDIEHDAVFFKAPIKDSNKNILVWTTTPWTLTSNVAIAVNPNNTYVEVKLKSSDQHLVLGKEALKVLKGDVETVVKEFLGSELVGLEYETCFPTLSVQNFKHTIVEWQDVTALDGSGAVHIAPGCGEEDFELGRKLGLKEILPIDENGIILPEFGVFAGQKASEVKDTIFEELKKQNKLYYTHKFTHSYPVCWRCKTEILFRLVESWFIKVDGVRPLLKQAVEEVEWQPEYLKKRMHDWLDNMGDWNISRSRYYGVPLPIYVTEKGEVIVVESKEELRELAIDKSLVDNIPHLHRPYIDEIKIKSKLTGDIATRIPDVGDAWLDAGITPFSTNKYFTDKKFWEQNFPAEVVIEMNEQIRLWFYSLLLMSVVITGKAPYKKVVAHGSMVQEDGSKFSKSGYSIKANEFADKMGADTARYMFASNPLTLTVRFSYNLAEEARRKLLGFWNSYTFFNTYAVIDDPKLEGFVPKETDLTVTDKWLLQLTNEFIVKSIENYNEHKAYDVVKDFESFVDNISNFYIRSNRRRFWKNDGETDKLVAYYTLYQALKAITLTMAPILPFMTEHIYQNLVREIEPKSPESVYLHDFAKPIENINYEEFLSYVEHVKLVVTLGQRLRNENQLKVKQPLNKLYVVSENETVSASVSVFEELIADELNIKQIVNTTNVEQFNDYYLTVNFKTAGAVLKGNVQALKNKLESLTQQEMNKLVNEFDGGKVEFEEFGMLNSELFVKTSKPKSEFVLAQENNTTVALDTTLTQELVQEGTMREIVRHAQVLRKEADFNIESRIELNINTENAELKNIVSLYSDKIKDEVLAINLNETEFKPEIERVVVVNENELTISMKTV